MNLCLQKNNINFTSTYLYPVNLIGASGSNLFVPGLFSRLNLNDVNDVNAVRKIQNTWINNDTAEFFCDEFIYNSELKPYILKRLRPGLGYNCIEIISKNGLYKSIAGIAATDLIKDLKTKKTSMAIRWLTTKNDLQANVPERQVKNVGEVLLGAIFNEARKNKAENVHFNSICDSFYKHSFDKANIEYKEFCSSFSIDKKEFNKYLSYIKNRFKIDF